MDFSTGGQGTCWGGRGDVVIRTITSGEETSWSPPARSVAGLSRVRLVTPSACLSPTTNVRRRGPKGTILKLLRVPREIRVIRENAPSGPIIANSANFAGRFGEGDGGSATPTTAGSWSARTPTPEPVGRIQPYADRPSPWKRSQLACNATRAWLMAAAVTPMSFATSSVPCPAARSSAVRRRRGARASSQSA